MTRKITLLCFVTCVAATSAQANVQLNSVDRGWYTDSGAHTRSNANYIAGNLDGEQYNNFFVFDISPDTYTAGTLRLFNPDSPDGYSGPNATETYVLYDVTTPISTLVSAGGRQAFADLGSGSTYGSQIVSAADNGQFIDITLNASAIAAINSASGLFAIGGTVPTATGSTEFVFGYSNGPSEYSQLLLSTNAAVPEPTTLAIFSILLLGAVGRVYAQRR